MRRGHFEGPEFFLDPWSIYRRYRRDQPVVWSATMKSFAVFRAADIRHVLTSPDFTVEYRFRTTRLAFGETLLDIDGENHARIRKQIAAMILSAEAQELFTSVSERTAKALLQELPQRESFDFMTQVAERVPVLNTCGFLGFPCADARWLRDRLTILTTGLTGADLSASALSAARRNIEEYIQDIVHSSSLSADGVGALMLRAAEDGSLSAEEMLRAIFVLLAAGTETSECALGNVAFCLLRFPEAISLVRAGGASREDVIREALRWEPPQHDTVRFAATNARIGNVEIPAGSAVRLYLASGNRDDAVYDEPDAFIPSRKEKATMTFGYGKHVCLGAKLSTIQLVATFASLLGEARTFERVGDVTAAAIEGDTFRRPKKLMMTFSAKRQDREVQHGI